MIGGWLVSLVAMALPAVALTCPDPQLSLHDYRAPEMGESYLKGKLVFGTIADGERCEKPRRDLGVHRCRSYAARRVALLPHNGRTEPARYERMLAIMKVQKTHGLRMIAEAKSLGCRVPNPSSVR